MKALQRVTIEYIAQEDRIRLSGQRAEARPLAIWLTRRLLDRLMPELLRWIEREGGDLLGANTSDANQNAAIVPRGDMLHSFAQQAARTRLTHQEPVRVAADDEAWLAQSVTVSCGGRAIRLTFHAASGQDATVTFTTQPLRQWLNILHDSYLKAEWPLQVWPEWVREAAPRAQIQVTVRH
jgi:hypothetical protein